MAIGYAVMSRRNAETQHWRGLLRGYEVTQGHTCMCACTWVRMHVRAGVRVRWVRNHVTV